MIFLVLFGFVYVLIIQCVHIYLIHLRIVQGPAVQSRFYEYYHLFSHMTGNHGGKLFMLLFIYLLLVYCYFIIFFVKISSV